jgi:hypothetical protein
MCMRYGSEYLSTSAVQYHFLFSELQNDVRMALKSRLTSACGRHRLQEQRGEATAAFEGPHGPLEIRLTFWFESRRAMDSKVSTTRTMRLARLCVTLRWWCCAAQGRACQNDED